ncbi:MAG: pilus assembly protein PilM [Candidatus Lindowbacteria bacterium]|nr:pilus assembly protein PilM [Candidatus Lindowbacteria bacterium]
MTTTIQKLMKVDPGEAERLKVSYARTEFGKASQSLIDNIDVAPIGDEPEEEAGEGPPEGTDDTTEPMAEVKTDSASRIVSATRPALSRLIGEIRRSIDYYEKQLYEKNVNRMVLSGGTAMFPGLDQSLADAAGVPVEIVNPVQTLMVEEGSPDVKDLVENRAQFNVAVGLAARGMEEL